jgi:hypothetical protein
MLGYPRDALHMALDMCAMRRLLVFRRGAGPEMRAWRGICAGSAFATRELYLVMANALARLEAAFNLGL